MDGIRPKKGIEHKSPAPQGNPPSLRRGEPLSLQAELASQLESHWERASAFRRQERDSLHPVVTEAVSRGSALWDAEGSDPAREQEAAARKHNQVNSLAQVTAMRLHTLDPQLGHFIYSQEPLLEVLAGARTGTVLSVEKDALLADFLVFQDALSTLGGKKLEWVPLDEERYWLGDWQAVQALLGSKKSQLSAVQPALLLNISTDFTRGLTAPTCDAKERAQARALFHRARAGEKPPYQPWEGRINHINLITYNRPASLAKTLNAYWNNLRQFGRDHVQVLVWDDSSGEVAEQNQEVVRDLVARGAPLRYVGGEQKQAWRAQLEPGLAQSLKVSPERVAETLDALLGTFDAQGKWLGSAASQRNWVSLLFAGKRTLCADDDAFPDLLDCASEVLESESRASVQRQGSESFAPTTTRDWRIGFHVTSRLTDKIEDFESSLLKRALRDGDLPLPEFVAYLKSTDSSRSPELQALIDSVREQLSNGCWHFPQHTPFTLRPYLQGAKTQTWMQDLLARFESLAPGLRSAEYTGHADNDANTVVGQLVSETSGYGDTLEGAVSQVTYSDAANSSNYSFRGSLFVTSGTLDGIEYASPLLRNEDFLLEMTKRLTSQEESKPEGNSDVFHFHQRGLRFTNHAVTLRAEEEANLFDQVLAALMEDCVKEKPATGFDFTAFALAAREWMEQQFDSFTDRLSLSNVLSVGMSARMRVEKHLDFLEALHAQVQEGLQRGENAFPASLFFGWYPQANRGNDYALGRLIRSSEAYVAGLRSGQGPTSEQVLALEEARQSWSFDHAVAPFSFALDEPCQVLGSASREARAHEVEQWLALESERVQQDFQYTDEDMQRIREDRFACDMTLVSLAAMETQPLPPDTRSYTVTGDKRRSVLRAWIAYQQPALSTAEQNEEINRALFSPETLRSAATASAALLNERWSRRPEPKPDPRAFEKELSQKIQRARLFRQELTEEFQLPEESDPRAAGDYWTRWKPYDEAKERSEIQVRERLRKDVMTYVQGLPVAWALQQNLYRLGSES